jgi:hypothetical protein
MSIWNKVLLGLIIITSLVFFYMSARMLKTYKYWNDLAQKHEAAIRNLEAENKILLEGHEVGGEFQPGIEQLRVELNKLIADRHRVWYNCSPSVNINKQTSAVTVKVNIEQPDPHGIADKTILYAFEEGGKGRYLGEFKATSVADKQVTLEPAFKLLPLDLKKLASAKRSWVLYDSMPHDSHEILGELSEKDKKALLPADSLTEYLKDGKPAAEDDPAELKVNGKYERMLRDYPQLFNAYRMKITLLIDQQQAAMRDQRMVEDSLADAQRQVQFYQNQATIFKAVAAKFAQQRDAVQSYMDQLQEKLATLKKDVENLLENNKAMAGQIAKIQLEATRRIDQRTHAMAQSASGEK